MSRPADGNADAMRKVAGTLLVVAAIAVAGCGGDSDGGGSTGSTASTSTATVASQPAPTPRANTDAAYQDYVDELAPILQPVMDFGTMTSRVRDIFSDLPQEPGDEWDTAADQVDDLAGDMRDTAASVRQVAPPEDLADVHEQLVSAYTESSQAFDGISTALRDHDLDELKDAVDVDQSGTQPNEWMEAIGAAKDEHGVKLPDWLQQYVTLLTRPSTTTG